MYTGSLGLLRSVLEAARLELEAGTAVYKPSGGATAHSSMSTATGFMTPALAGGQRATAARSPTLELTAPVQARFRGYAFRLACSAFRTDGALTRRDLQEGRLGGGNDQAREVTARTRQARTGTTATGHSLSSDEATYTLHGNETRGASPAGGAREPFSYRKYNRPKRSVTRGVLTLGWSHAAGHTAASSSGHGSGDENVDTLNLKSGRAAPPQKPGDEPTCVISQSLQRKRIAHRPINSSARPLRRIGKSARAPLFCPPIVRRT